MDLNNGIVMTVDLGADAGEKVVGDLVDRDTGETTNIRGARYIIMILIPSGAIHELLP